MCSSDLGFKGSFIGAVATAKSLRKMAAFFDDPALTARVEAVIADELVRVEAAAAEVKPRCTGKTAMLFLGGSRAHHYQDLFAEIGMRTIAAGYEFAHRDDYEGRKVLPSITVDADSRNIEELEVEPDPQRYRARLTDAKRQALASVSFEFNDYQGMMPQMEDEALVIDDLNEQETQRLLELCKPDIFCAGIKEKYGAQKHGIPCKQLHSYDYGGPYAGFQGAINFYREIDRLVNTRIWSFIQPPWEAAASPVLEATYARA